MDSMRQLSTSLPKRRNDQPQDLLSDFKAAALSVTNLYKTAATAQTKSRAAGYQDALDDLLVFLDKENLGLMDGEGWRVRQWATERLDEDGRGGMGQRQPAGSDDDEEATKEEEAAGTRSSSPETQRKPNTTAASSDVAEEASPRRRIVSEPPQVQPVQQQSRVEAPTAPSMEDFTFRSTHAYPTNHDRQSNNMDLDTGSTPSNTETVRILPRTTRNRHTNHNRHRGENRTGTINLNLGAGAGSKRKIPYPDFFDISGINFEGQDRRDGNGGRGGGGKRGRFV